MELPPEGAFPTKIYCWTCKVGNWFLDEPHQPLRCTKCGDPYRVRIGGRIVEPNGPREFSQQTPGNEEEQRYGGM